MWIFVACSRRRDGSDGSVAAKSSGQSEFCMGIAFLAVLAAVGAKQAAGGLYTDVTIPDKYHATPLPRRPLFV